MRAHVVDGTSGGLRALAAGALALSAGCAMDFDPVSLLTETRVLAVEVTPLEVGPGERVRLTPRVFVPAGSTTATTATWSFCPFTAGARAGYACALPACETSLTGGADGALDADPTALALACIEKLTASGVSLGAGTSTGTPQLPEQVEMLFRLTVAGLTTLVRVPYYPGGVPMPRNTPPRIAEITLGGVAASTTTPAAPLAKDAKLDVVVRADPTSLDSYVDEADRARNEEPIVSYYTTAGRFENDRADGLDATGTLEAIELLPADTSATVYVVLRDGRGGQVARGPFVVPLTQ